MPAAPAVAAETAATGARRIVGILALQGAFEEHEASFRQLPPALLKQIEVRQVRTSEELDRCDGLVIPGGESTTMKLIAGYDTFMDHLKAFVHGGVGSDGVHRPRRPVWGTCAGCILLSDDAVNELPGLKGDVQEPETKRCKFGPPVGGLAVKTCRNFFGRQEQSFEGALSAEKLAGEEDDGYRAFANFPAVFIRAPAILQADAGVRVLARVKHPSVACETGAIVAAASRDVMITCFHPELARDSRIHAYFVEHFVLGASESRAEKSAEK